MLEVLHDVRDAVGFASDNDGSDGLSGQAVWNDLKHARYFEISSKNTLFQIQMFHIINSVCLHFSIPFLRVAAVFYHYLTQVPPPPNFTDFSANEHEELSQYLGLPTNPQDLFKVTISLCSINFQNVKLRLYGVGIKFLQFFNSQNG